MSSIKENLRNYYNQEAEHRNASYKQDWKLKERKAFLDLAKHENKQILLELGAGTGDDSLFFMENGLKVTAVDLSAEMVKRCKEKGINAYELDYYQVTALNKQFQCVWAMNSLLHVPKTELPRVLTNIDSVLEKNGLFYMGVYGGVDSESEYVTKISEHPRFFSFYTQGTLQNVLKKHFEIISFRQLDVGRRDKESQRGFDFQSILMQKRQM